MNEKKLINEIVSNVADNEVLEDSLNEALYSISLKLQKAINDNVITFHHKTDEKINIFQSGNKIIVTLCQLTYSVNKKRIVKRYKKTNNYSLEESVLFELCESIKHYYSI